MSSRLFKTFITGAVAAGALLLSGTSAQAADKHRPCDEPGFGFGNGSLFGDQFGGQFGDRLGFGDDFGMFGDDFGMFSHHRRDDRPTVIVVTVHKKNHHKKNHHHKPATPDTTTPDTTMPDNPPATTTGTPAGAGYQKPAAAPYRKG